MGEGDVVVCLGEMVPNGLFLRHYLRGFSREAGEKLRRPHVGGQQAGMCLGELGKVSEAAAQLVG